MKSNKYKRSIRKYKSESWMHRPLDMLERMKLEELKESLPNYCEKCGSKINLEIHHIKPRSKFPELMFERSNVQRLCNKCHTEIENKIK